MPLKNSTFGEWEVVQSQPYIEVKNQNTGKTLRLTENAGIENVESLSATSVNNEYYAGNFAGSNGREKIQNAIDTAATKPSGGTVIVDGRGPDDVSASSGAIGDALLAENAWELDSHLTIPSLVTVKFVSCYVFLADGADDNLIRTAGVSGGQTARWALLGENAILDGNGENQTTFNRDTNSDAIKNLGIRITNAREFVVRGLQMRNTNAWSIRAEQIEDAIFSELQFQQLSTFENTDGLNVIGPAENFVISDLEGLTDDDMVGIKCDDPDLFVDGSGGDVLRSTVANLTHESAQEGAHAIRYLCGDNNYVLRNHSATNVISDGGNGALEIGFNQSVGNINDVSHLNFSNIASRNSSGPAVDIFERCKYLNLSNISADEKGAVTIRDDCKHLNATNLFSGTNGFGISIVNSSTVKNATFDNVTVDEPNMSHVLLVGSSSSADNLTVSGITGLMTGTIFSIEGTVTNALFEGINMEEADSLMEVTGSINGSINNVQGTFLNGPYSGSLGDITLGPQMPAHDSAPPQTLNSFARASPVWDPDGDGNGEWVVSDGTAWQEVVDLPNWT